MENYRFRDLVYAAFRLPFISSSEKAGLRERAGVLDDTWTLTEQLAKERYQSSRNKPSGPISQMLKDMSRD